MSDIEQWLTCSLANARAQLASRLHQVNLYRNKVNEPPTESRPIIGLQGVDWNHEAEKQQLIANTYQHDIDMLTQLMAMVKKDTNA